MDSFLDKAANQGKTLQLIYDVGVLFRPNAFAAAYSLEWGDCFRQVLLPSIFRIATMIRLYLIASLI